MLHHKLTMTTAACVAVLASSQAITAAPIVSYDLTGPVPTMNVDLNVGGPADATLHITPGEFQLSVGGSDYAWPTPDSDPVYAIAIHGSDHPDELLVTAAAQSVDFDLLVGFVGNGGNDMFENTTDYTAIAYGGAGNDELIGGPSTDYLVGDAGSDTLLGGGGDDVLSGGTGPDDLSGEAGDDLLMGDASLTTFGPAIPDEPQADGSVDLLTGGPGADTFIENYYVDVDVENPYAIDNLLVEQDDVVDAMRGDTLLDQEVLMPVWGPGGAAIPTRGGKEGSGRVAPSSLSIQK